MTNIGAKPRQWFFKFRRLLSSEINFLLKLYRPSGVLRILVAYMKAVPDTSGLHQLPLDAPALDLTGKITKLDDHYSNAGGFSDVYKARYTGTDGVKEVAVKVFRFRFAVAESEGRATRNAKMIHRELGIWRRLCHPNIVPFLGIVYDFERHGTTSLVSEWMYNGTLDSFVAQYDDRLIPEHRLQLLMDIANGLFYLHSFPMVHGDLTCTNVLLDRNFSVCLTDFGLASMVGDIPDALRYLQMTTMRPGALRWAAPEHFSVTNAVPQRTTKSDVYSFGNLALLTLSGKHPWSEVPLDIAVVLRLHQGDKPSRPASRPIEDRHWELIERCWLPVDERPQAGDIVSTLKHFLELRPPIQPLRDVLRISFHSTIMPSDPLPSPYVEPNMPQGAHFDGNKWNLSLDSTIEPSDPLPSPYVEHNMHQGAHSDGNKWNLPPDSTIEPSDPLPSPYVEHNMHQGAHFDGNIWNLPLRRRRPSWDGGTSPSSFLSATSAQEHNRRRSFGGDVKLLESASPLSGTFPTLQLHSLLNEEALSMAFYFDFALPSLGLFRWIGFGQSAAISDAELRLPATNPPIMQMRISHNAIPQWPIDLDFQSDPHTTIPTPIRIGDVLYRIHWSLHTQITHQDWARLSLREETVIARAYTRRCKSVPASADVQASQGVKRIDYLLDKHIFRGLVRTHDEGDFYHWKLITV